MGLQTGTPASTSNFPEQMNRQLRATLIEVDLKLDGQCVDTLNPPPDFIYLMATTLRSDSVWTLLKSW